MLSRNYYPFQMQTTVLLSIKPAFAESIFNGTKAVEFRRVIFKSKDVRKVVLYASDPVRKVVGEFQIGDVLSMDLDILWTQTRHQAGIDKNYFYSYFSGRSVGHAIRIERPRRYNIPLDLEEEFSLARPPQSFQYVTSGKKND